MKTKIILALLILALTACAPATTPAISMTSVQSTAFAAAYTGVALTQTALPTATPPPPTVTSTATVVAILPTPPPTQPPIPILTPDAIQVERWREYQTELAKALFATRPNPQSGGYKPEAYKTALCEWDILGQEKQVVFVFVDCIGGEFYVVGDIVIDNVGTPSSPAAVFLEPDGSIRNVVIPSYKFDFKLFQYYDLHLFPLDAKEKLCLYYFYGEVPECHDVTPAYQPYLIWSRPPVLHSHLVYRATHPDEPPLVVLSATPIATPTP